jgi:hypothetical protein
MAAAQCSPEKHARGTAGFVHVDASAKRSEEISGFAAEIRNRRPRDPTVMQLTRLDGGAVMLGSRFEVEIDAASGLRRLSCELTELEPGRRVRARAADGRLASDHLVVIEEGDDGARARTIGQIERQGHLVAGRASALGCAPPYRAAVGAGLVRELS